MLSKLVVKRERIGGEGGGDEFGVLIINPFHHECEKCANNLLSAFEKMSAEILPDLSLSIGLVNSHQMKIDELLGGADKLLYHSKKSGGRKITKAE